MPTIYNPAIGTTTTGGQYTIGTISVPVTQPIQSQPEDLNQPQAPKENDVEIVDNFEFVIGSTKIILKNATKELIENITKIMLKDRNAEEKPTSYVEEDD